MLAPGMHGMQTLLSCYLLFKIMNMEKFLYFVKRIYDRGENTTNDTKKRDLFG